MTDRHKKALVDFYNRPDDYAKWLIGELDATSTSGINMEFYEPLKSLANKGGNLMAKDWMRRNGFAGDLYAN